MESARCWLGRVGVLGAKCACGLISNPRSLLAAVAVPRCVSPSSPWPRLHPRFNESITPKPTYLARLNVEGEDGRMSSAGVRRTSLGRRRRQRRRANLTGEPAKTRLLNAAAASVWFDSASIAANRGDSTSRRPTGRSVH